MFFFLTGSSSSSPASPGRSSSLTSLPSSSCSAQKKYKIKLEEYIVHVFNVRTCFLLFSALLLSSLSLLAFCLFLRSSKSSCTCKNRLILVGCKNQVQIIQGEKIMKPAGFRNHALSFFPGAWRASEASQGRVDLFFFSPQLVAPRAGQKTVLERGRRRRRRGERLFGINGGFGWESKGRGRFAKVFLFRGVGAWRPLLHDKGLLSGGGPALLVTQQREVRNWNT